MERNEKKMKAEDNDVKKEEEEDNEVDKKEEGEDNEAKKETKKKEKEQDGVDEVEMDRLMALEYHQKAQVLHVAHVAFKGKATFEWG